jgi:hypothetical protein
MPARGNCGLCVCWEIWLQAQPRRTWRRGLGTAYCRSVGQEWAARLGSPGRQRPAMDHGLLNVGAVSPGILRSRGRRHARASGAPASARMGGHFSLSRPGRRSGQADEPFVPEQTGDHVAADEGAGTTEHHSHLASDSWLMPVGNCSTSAGGDFRNAGREPIPWASSDRRLAMPAPAAT